MRTAFVKTKSAYFTVSISFKPGRLMISFWPYPQSAVPCTYLYR